MKTTIIIVLLSLGLVLGIVALNAVRPTTPVSSAGAAEIVDGKQVIEIKAKGGYTPKVSTAQAGVPGILRVKTSGTYDCSSVFTIPSLNYKTNLPPTGVTEVEIPPQEPGSVLRGTCGMGMYNFEVRFN
jgi:plastocyanin domain-containing protein